MRNGSLTALCRTCPSQCNFDEKHHKFHNFSLYSAYTLIIACIRAAFPLVSLNVFIFHVLFPIFPLLLQASVASLPKLSLPYKFVRVVVVNVANTLISCNPKERG